MKQIIAINNMRLYSHIGVHPEEKKLGQPIAVDLKIKTTDVTPVQTDSIDDTLSYSRFYHVVADLVTNSRVDLIETLAQQILRAVQESYPEKHYGVHVTVRKLGVPIAGTFDSVAVTLEDEHYD